MMDERDSIDTPRGETEDRSHDGENPSTTPADVACLQTRKAMLTMCVLLLLAILFSLGFFGYVLYRFWSTAGLFVRTTVPWPSLFGHALRIVGLALIIVRLAALARRIDAQTGTPSIDFALYQRMFWRTSAWTLAILGAFTAFEIVYTSRQTTYEFFRPEFESGYVTINPDRIEFRRGSVDPVDEWIKKKPDGEWEKELFVSPRAEITGSDIRRAVVRIAEIFPGSQSAELHIQFTDEGRKKMKDFTETHLTLPIAVLIDGKLRATPTVFRPITDEALLHRVFTIEEAANMIRKGQDHE